MGNVGAAPLSTMPVPHTINCILMTYFDDLLPD
jgi:hypothetical protein